MSSVGRPHHGVRAPFILAALVVLWAAGGLIGRGARGRGDFSRFYRTAQALHAGAGADLYAETDVPGGRHCIPPSGTVFFFYMPWVSGALAATVWYLFLAALLVLDAWCLRRLFERLDRQRRLYLRLWPWAVLVLSLLAYVSLQVGQFSVLFVTCWLAYLLLDGGLAPAVMLMLPAAIKLYPALLWAVPLALRRYRQLLWLAPAAVLIVVLLPLPFYGSRLPGLWQGFIRATLLDPAHGRLGDMFHPDEENDQSLDNQLFRYLTDQPELTRRRPYFPHLRLDPDGVAKLVAGLKLGLLIVTCLAAWRLGARATTQPRWTALMMLGLWSVTLVLLLPENKAPYIVYCFPAWLPVLAMAAAGRERRRRLGASALVALGVICQMQAMPYAVRAFGPALATTIVLWLMLCRIAWRAAPVRETHPVLDSR